MRKAKSERVTKRTLKLHADERVKRYEEVMSVEHIVKDLLSDCVDAVAEKIADENNYEEINYEEIEEKMFEVVEVKPVVKVTPNLVPCLTKLGQNIFSNEEEPFTQWLDSLMENALYKALLNAHSAMDL